MNGEKKQPFLAWALLILALFAVSSAGTILQSMEGIPPFLRASWRMQGTSLILFPLFIMQYLNKTNPVQGKVLYLGLLGCTNFCPSL